MHFSEHLLLDYSYNLLVLSTYACMLSQHETSVSEHERLMHTDAATHVTRAETSSVEQSLIMYQDVSLPQSRRAVLSFPTTNPSASPTGRPSSPPTTRPSNPPTLRPSNQPTLQPNAQPTLKPALKPTAHPTLRPTPTQSPSPAPSPVGLEKIEQVGSSAQVLVWLLIIVAIAAGVYCYWQRKETLLKRAKVRRQILPVTYFFACKGYCQLTSTPS